MVSIVNVASSSPPASIEPDMDENIEIDSNADKRHERASPPAPSSPVRRCFARPASISFNGCPPFPFRTPWRQPPSPDSDESMPSPSVSAQSPPSAKTSPIRSARVTLQTTDHQIPTSHKRALNTRPPPKNFGPFRPPPALRQGTPCPVTWANAETESEGDPSPLSHWSASPQDRTRPPDDPPLWTNEGLRRISDIFRDMLVLASTTRNALAHGEDAAVEQAAVDQDKEMNEGGYEGEDEDQEHVARTGEDFEQGALSRQVTGDRTLSASVLRRNTLVLLPTGRKRESSGGSDDGFSIGHETGIQDRKDGRRIKRLKGKDNLE